MTRYIPFTLRSIEKSQSLSSHSRIEPWCTKPAQLNSTWTAPISFAAAATSSVRSHVEPPGGETRQAREPPQPFLVDVRRDDLRPLGREGPGGGLPDALGGGGHQRLLARQPASHAAPCLTEWSRWS